MTARPHLWQTLPDGGRVVSWRLWVLIWVAPVLFLAAAALMFGQQAWRHVTSQPIEAQVVRVYDWPGETVFDRGQTKFGPVFRYQWTDGTMTEASTGMSHPDFDFPVGSVHEIRYFPDRKGNVVLPGIHNWMAPSIILGIGAVLLAPALWATARVKRWLDKGAPR